MKTIVIVCLLLAVSIEMSWARPRYLAIPLEDVEFLEVQPKEEVAPLTRTARAALPRERRWNEEQKDDQQIVATDDQGRFQRGIHGGGGSGGDGGHQDHVDFGAHTGHHGAFGWYADFPVQKDH